MITTEPSQALQTSVFIAATLTILMSGCAAQRARFNQEFGRQMELRQKQAPQMAHEDQQRQTERDNAELSKLIKPVPKIEMVPLEMSNGLPKKAPEPPLPILTGMGIPTGRMRMAADGITYYEMKSVNGAIYWTDKK